MAIKTMNSTATGQNKWVEGWHTVVISEAFYGTWNEKRYLEIKFEDYPDNFTLRTYETFNKETHEEFNVTKLFKLANAGLIDKIKSPDGKEAIQYDDEPMNLVGKSINVFFYKDKSGYNKISDRIAPVEQEGEVVSYTADNVKFWKDIAEKDWLKRLKADAPASGSNTTTPNTEGEEIPF